jgi:hypothetical protein
VGLVSRDQDVRAFSKADLIPRTIPAAGFNLLLKGLDRPPASLNHLERLVANSVFGGNVLAVILHWILLRNYGSLQPELELFDELGMVSFLWSQGRRPRDEDVSEDDGAGAGVTVSVVVGNLSIVLVLMTCNATKVSIWAYRGWYI